MVQKIPDDGKTEFHSSTWSVLTGNRSYGSAGALRGDDLPTMLLASLKRSGRAFTNQEADFLQKTVRAAELALQSGNLLKTGVVLAEAGKLGPLDNLGSYATPAIRSKEIYTELKQRTETGLTAAKSKLLDSNSEPAFEPLLTIHEGEAISKLYPQWKSSASSITREINRQPEYADLSEQAEAVVKAASSQPRCHREYAIVQRASTRASFAVSPTQKRTNWPN